MEDQNFNQEDYTEQPAYGGHPQYSVPEEPKPSNTMAILSLVFGIISLLLPCACCIGSITFTFVVAIVGVILGIAAIVLCVMSKKVSRTGMATAGMVCGIIGIVLNLALVVFLFIGLATYAAMGIDINDIENMSPDELQRLLQDMVD